MAPNGSFPQKVHFITISQHSDLKMSCTGVTFADLCQKVMKYWFGRLLLRNVRFRLPREAIYVVQDHYFIAFADFDEIPEKSRISEIEKAQSYNVIPPGATVHISRNILAK